MLIAITFIAVSSCSPDRTSSPKCQEESSYKNNRASSSDMPDFKQIKQETDSRKTPYGSTAGNGRVCN